MRRIDGLRTEPLHDATATRALERAASTGLPPHTLMNRAGQSIARLALALSPHARSFWIACGPGNNGGDGLTAANWLHQHSQSRGLDLNLTITLAGDPHRLPDEAAHAWKLAQAAGLQLSERPPAHFDFAVDALLGIGATRPATGELALHWQQLSRATAPVLSVDVPSGLETDTGALLSAIPPSPCRPGPRYTLSLLTLKPGLFTAQGRDCAGEVWLDDLGVADIAAAPATALLRGPPDADAESVLRHASHKGSHGDVLVLGGQGMDVDGAGMSGAAVLAARAALNAGAGRVYLCLLGTPSSAQAWDPLCPELMLRTPAAAMTSDLPKRSTVVCGCGGGQAVDEFLPALLKSSPSLVLDADALNAIAGSPTHQQLLVQRQHGNWTTVLTPHPLEAARLLRASTESVMANRLLAAQSISERWGVICVLKGSGTVISAPGMTPRINSSGNGLLATAGTGDVLAGMIGAALASPQGRLAAASCTADAVFHHGRIADQWLKHLPLRHLGASQLATGLVT